MKFDGHHQPGQSKWDSGRDLAVPARKRLGNEEMAAFVIGSGAFMLGCKVAKSKTSGPKSQIFEEAV
jgi:hypothetical protein